MRRTLITLGAALLTASATLATHSVAQSATEVEIRPAALECGSDIQVPRVVGKHIIVEGDSRIRLDQPYCERLPTWVDRVHRRIQDRLHPSRWRQADIGSGQVSPRWQDPVPPYVLGKCPLSRPHQQSCRDQHPGAGPHLLLVPARQPTAHSAPQDRLHRRPRGRSSRVLHPRPLSGRMH